MKPSYKKGMIAACLVGLLVSPFSVYAEEEKKDYFATDLYRHWASEEIEDYLFADLVSGMTNKDGDLEIQPNRNITRAEFSALLVRILGLEHTKGAKDFQDVKKKDWYYDVIQIASANGIVYGKTATKFMPNEPITRAEIAVMIDRAFAPTLVYQQHTKNFTDVSSSHWAKESINHMSGIEIISGTTEKTFEPNRSATRAEAIVMLHRTTKKEKTNLPSEEDLFQEVQKNGIYALYERLIEKDETKMYTFAEEVTGVYKEEVMLAYALFAWFGEASGFALKKVEQTEPFKYEIIDHSNRFAVVKETGKMKMEVYDGEKTEEEEADVENYYYLKKDEFKKVWRIYNTEEHSEQMSLSSISSIVDKLQK